MSKLNFAGLAVDPNELAHAVEMVRRAYGEREYKRQLTYIIGSDRYQLDHTLAQGESQHGDN